MVTMDTSSAISLLQSRPEKRHMILLYDEKGSFREFCAEYTKSLLQANNTVVVICPSVEELVESVLSELYKRGIDVATYTKNDSLIILNRVKEYFGENGKIVSYINSMMKCLGEAQPNNRICIIVDYTGLDYRTYDERFFPMKSDNALHQIMQDSRVAMICCFRERDFREQYSCMMKESMVNRHDEVIELNCRHFARLS